MGVPQKELLKRSATFLTIKFRDSLIL